MNLYTLSHALPPNKMMNWKDFSKISKHTDRSIWENPHGVKPPVSPKEQMKIKRVHIKKLLEDDEKAKIEKEKIKIPESFPVDYYDGNKRDAADDLPPKTKNFFPDGTIY